MHSSQYHLSILQCNVGKLTGVGVQVLLVCEDWLGSERTDERFTSATSNFLSVAGVSLQTMWMSRNDHSCHPADTSSGNAIWCTIINDWVALVVSDAPPIGLIKCILSSVLGKGLYWFVIATERGCWFCGISMQKVRPGRKAERGPLARRVLLVLAHITSYNLKDRNFFASKYLNGRSYSIVSTLILLPQPSDKLLQFRTRLIIDSSLFSTTSTVGMLSHHSKVRGANTKSMSGV